MSCKTAFRLLPIAHQYGMQLMFRWCEEAFERSQMTLWPSVPIASSEVTHYPGLVQCLALADSKQCDAMVQSCLSHLKKPGSAPASIIREALNSSDLGRLLDGLRSETKSAVIRIMADMPMGFKVCVVHLIHTLMFMMWGRLYVSNTYTFLPLTSHDVHSYHLHCSW